MKKITVSGWLWWTFAWTAAVALGLGIHFEVDYRDRVAGLPSLVDERGNIASLETAMAGIESYKKAKQVRTFGFVCLGVGVVLFVCAAGTKRKERCSLTLQ